jgi:hypothetical protein
MFSTRELIDDFITNRFANNNRKSNGALSYPEESALNPLRDKM